MNFKYFLNVICVGLGLVMQHVEAKSKNALSVSTTSSELSQTVVDIFDFILCILYY